MPNLHQSSRVRSLVRARRLAVLMGLLAAPVPANGAEVDYPQLIRTRYEAVDPKAGGSFIIWLDRDRLWHGLDARLYPAARYVEVSHLTPSPGSPLLTVIEVMSIASNVPEYYHVGGIVRFKMTGMAVKSTNAPPR
jgi:hypothetical protein